MRRCAAGDDRIAPANPMLARYGTSFGATGPMTGSAGDHARRRQRRRVRDEHAPTGAAEPRLEPRQPPTASASGSRPAARRSGPLFGFGDSPANIAGTNDRILYLSCDRASSNFILNTAWQHDRPTTGRTTTAPGTSRTCASAPDVSSWGSARDHGLRRRDAGDHRQAGCSVGLSSYRGTGISAGRAANGIPAAVLRRVAVQLRRAEQRVGTGQPRRRHDADGVRHEHGRARPGTGG